MFTLKSVFVLNTSVCREWASIGNTWCLHLLRGVLIVLKESKSLFGAVTQCAL